MAALVLLAGCGTTGPDPDTCRQAGGEFAIAGCAVLAGTVVDSTGAPLGGITLGPGYPAGVDCCTTTYVTSDADGRYSFPIRWVGVGFQDSLRIHVVAQRPPVGVLDSVPVRVRFASVGEPRPVTMVDLVLARPY